MRGQIKVIIAVVVVIGLILGVVAYTLSLERESGKEVTLTFTYQQSDHHLAAFIILEKHWIEEMAAEKGYKVTIVEESFPSGPPQMERFMAGAIDVAYVGAAPVVSEVAQALALEKEGKSVPKAVIVAAVNTQGSALVLRPELAETYEGPQSLKGKTLGTFPPGSIQDSLLKNWLEENGLKVGKDVMVISGTPPELIDLLATGKIDGAFLPSPGPEIAQIRGIGEIVETSADIAPGHLCCVLALSDRFIANYPELAEIVVKAHIKATSFIKEHPEEALEIGAAKLAKLWNYDIEFVRKILRLSLIKNVTGLEFTADPHAVAEKTIKYVEIQYELGYIPEKPTLNQLFNFTLYDKVVAEA
ncbi:MAG: ABC transporter substrate-binding protein [Candidatus Hecatellaceae archaeon]